MADHKEMLEDVQSADGAMGGIELNEWESEFIENIDDWLGDGKTLTPKQAESLEKIWDRI
jgi:hypothetical protein